MALTPRVSRRARRKYGLKVYSHRAWGSKRRGVYASRRRNRPVRIKKADTLVQHITVTRPTGNFKADARTVERIGYERFRSGVSYNYLVDMKTGEVAVGQPLDAKGTHTVNDKGRAGFSRDQNHAARAIAVVGMPDTPLTPKAADSIARLIAAMMDVGAITPTADYLPHSFFAWKDCPSDSTRNRMPAIWRRARQYHSGALPAKPAKKPQKQQKQQKPNRVTRARAKVAEAVKILRNVPKGRKAVHRGRERIEDAVKRMPER